MWSEISNIFIEVVEFHFSILNRLFNAIPGSYASVFTFISIALLCRFVLGPLFGAVFSLGSDRARPRKKEGET